jgi:hypothetical protein
MYKNFIDSQVIVSIHEDCNDLSSCSVGLIIYEDDNFIQLKSLSPEGFFFGYEIIQKSLICKIDYDSLFERKIEFLSKHQTIVSHKENFELDMANSDDIIHSSLKNLLNEEVIVIIWLEDDTDSIIGYVKQVDDNNVEVQIIDDFGREDGKVIIEIIDIQRMDINSKKAQLLHFLHENSF